MTIPFERTRALIESRQLLMQLENPARPPRDPVELQRIATWLLRHYPTLNDIEAAHKALPDVFGPVPPFSRVWGSTAITELGLDKLGPEKDQ